MWIVIIAFVATIVFAWGMDLTSRSRTKNAIGRVNGKEITINYFEKMVEQERRKAAGTIRRGRNASVPVEDGPAPGLGKRKSTSF